MNKRKESEEKLCTTEFCSYKTTLNEWKLGWTLYLIEVMKVYQLGKKCLLSIVCIFHTFQLTNRVPKYQDS